MTAPASSPHPKASREIPGLQLKTLNDPRVIEKLKVMDKYLFPVNYTDKYYTALVTNGFHKFNVLAYFNDMLVGSCTCRREKVEGDETAVRLYVMTIGVLEAYRRLGIGAKLMQKVMDAVASESHEAIADVSLHVQVGSPAFDFYKSFGFDTIEEVKGYYTNLDVNDALLLRKVIPQPKLLAKATKANAKK
jgi:ribosomal protein S18 acetylase RimI-like enzyme